MSDNSQLREPLNQALSRNVKCFFLLHAIQVAPQILALLHFYHKASQETLGLFIVKISKITLS